MFRTRSGKLELRFDDDIADFAIANVEAALKLQSVVTSMQELEARWALQKMQEANLD
jgi:hypothetical protein